MFGILHGYMMGNSTFETVYRISLLDQSHVLWLPAFGAVMVLLIIRGIKRIRTPETGRKGWSRWVIDWPPWFQIASGALGLLLCVVVLTVAIIPTGSDLYTYWSQTYKVSEGVVTVLHQQPRSGHDQGDIVRIGDDQFEVNYFQYTPGYDRTITHGGVLRDGVYVRVFHDKGTILRIDIRKENRGIPDQP